MRCFSARSLHLKYDFASFKCHISCLMRITHSLFICLMTEPRYDNGWRVLLQSLLAAPQSPPCAVLEPSIVTFFESTQLRSRIGRHSENPIVLIEWVLRCDPYDLLLLSTRIMLPKWGICQWTPHTTTDLYLYYRHLWLAPPLLSAEIFVFLKSK